MATVRTRTGGRAPLSAERGCLLIADISGYTGYVVSSPLAYAEDVIADVTATVAENLGQAFVLNKLEGDAVFGYALAGDADATMILDAIEECYFAFRNRLRGIEHATQCSCNACAKLPELNLKFAAHAGTFIRRPGERGEELTGHDVILVHRLLKNTVTEAFGLSGYVLFTDAFVEELGIDPLALGMREHRETYGDVGDVRSFVSDLDARWREEQERRHVFVTPEEAAFEVEAFLPAPSAVVWEYLTAPDGRTRWQNGRIEESSRGGRRGPGTTSYCVDGRAAVYEEILDWRPFHYFTESRSLPRSAKLVLTTELEPAGEMTRVRTRGRRSNNRKRPAWLGGERGIARTLEAGYGRLAAILDTEGAESGKREPVDTCACGCEGSTGKHD